MPQPIPCVVSGPLGCCFSTVGGLQGGLALILVYCRHTLPGPLPPFPPSLPSTFRRCCSALLVGCEEV